MKPAEACIQSRMTAQGQVSIPAEVRRRLGLSPGTLIEWRLGGATVIVRRAGRFTSEDLHRAVFPDGPPARISSSAMKEAIRERMRRRHAGR